MKKTVCCASALAVCAAFGAIRSVTPDPYGGNEKTWQLQRCRE